MAVKLIAHVLVKCDRSYLVIKRSSVKRGKVNFFPCYWDIPGGSVEKDELPLLAAVRECQEETGIFLDKTKLSILHEDSNLDVDKNTIFTRLVYQTTLADKPLEIVLDSEEHTEFKWIRSLNELAGENVVPYLHTVFEREKK